MAEVRHLDADADVPPEARVAVVAHLSRYRGASREHTESDLRLFFDWCGERSLAPLDARRNDLELYARWMQDFRRREPSTVSRRMSVAACFYRTCVIDGLLEHSPAEHVRRPRVPPESPTLGLTHLQFEALLTAARSSANPNDFALVCLLGLLGLRVFEATGISLDDLGEEHGHRVVRSAAKAARSCSCRSRRRSAAPSTAPPPTEPPARCCSTSEGPGWTGTPRPAGLRRLAFAAGVRLPRMHPHMLRHTYVTTMLDAGVDLRDVQVAARHADPRTTMRYDRARNNLDRHPNYILAAYMASGT